MPAVIPVPGVLEIQLVHADETDYHIRNRSYWSYAGGEPSDATCATLATEVAAAWNTDLAPLAGTAVTLVEVVVTDLSSDSGGRGSWAGSNAGSRSGAATPVGVCAVQNYQISRRYRGGKPRTYWPFLTADDYYGNKAWAAASVAAVDTGWNAYTAAIGALSVGGVSGLAHVNISYYYKSVLVINPISGVGKNVAKPRDTPLVDPITGNSTSTVFGSQRRRNRAS